MSETMTGTMPETMTGTMPETITISKEDYLKAILEADSEGLHVIPATLAHWLRVSAPAVTMALKRLRRDGYVDVQEDGVVRLTAQGREAAYRTALRHHLIERMLSEIFGMDWYEIHPEAERLEHAVSPAFEALLIDKLGSGGTCPHGNTVLPERPEQRRDRGLSPLFDAVPGEVCRVEALYERDPKLLIYLHQLGVDPQAVLRVVARNYDETLSLETSAGAVTLGRAAAERVWVSRSHS